MLRLCILTAALALACPAQSFLNRRIPLDQAKRWQGIRVLPDKPILLADNTASNNRCAHIMTYMPPKDLDKGIVKSERGEVGAIRRLPAMPTCEADIRPLGTKPTASEEREDGESARD